MELEAQNVDKGACFTRVVLQQWHKEVLLVQVTLKGLQDHI